MTGLSLSALAGMKILLVATVGVGLTGALLAWRERPEPGSAPLAILLAGQCWWSATLFFRLDATSLGAKVFWVDVSWLGIVAIPVAWLFFSLEYTGHSEYVRPRYVVIISVIPAICGLLGVTNQYHHLFYSDSVLTGVGGHAILDRTPAVGFWVIAGYTYLLGVLGAVPLLQFITSDIGLFKRQSVAILVGVFIPWTTNALFLLGVLPTGGVDPTPIAFSVSGIAYLGALTQFQLLGTSPAPIRPARRSVFRRMEEGALVLDRSDNVVDINHRAVEALQTTANEALGEPVRTIIPEFDTLVSEQSDATQPVVRPGSRAYEVSVNQLHDTHGRVTGRIVTLHDITEHYRQQQRLEVLNRVFRHNVRTNIQVIVGYADYLQNRNSEHKARKVQQKALEIEEIGEKIRAILDIFEQGRKETEPRQLTAMLKECVRSVRESYPEVSIETDIGPPDAYVDDILQKVFLNLIENAAQHNTASEPVVRISTTRDGERVRITVEDNGPGIDEDELRLVENEKETPLEHGSGFGLALAVWGIEIVGGEISFESNESTGTVVRTTVPLLPGDTGILDGITAVDEDTKDVVIDPQ